MVYFLVQLKLELDYRNIEKNLFFNVFKFFKKKVY